MPCLASKPIVNGIEEDLTGKVEVIRLNMLTRLGREIGTRYKVGAVPTTVIVNKAGDVVYRHAGIPNRVTIVQKALKLVDW